MYTEEVLVVRDRESMIVALLAVVLMGVLFCVSGCGTVQHSSEPQWEYPVR